MANRGEIKRRVRAAFAALGYVRVHKRMRDVAGKYNAVWYKGVRWIPPEQVADYQTELARRLALDAAAREADRNWRCPRCGSTERVACCSDSQCFARICDGCGGPAP